MLTQSTLSFKKRKQILTIMLSALLISVLPACSDITKSSSDTSETPDTQATGSSGGGSSSGSSSSSGGSSSGGTAPTSAPNAVSDLAWTGEVGSKFTFTWTDVPDATYYKLMENEDGNSGFSQIGQDIQQGNGTQPIYVQLIKKINAQYLIQSCNTIGCSDSSAVSPTGNLADLATYIKASNSEAGDNFGIRIALSSDGSTLVVSATGEDSNDASTPENNSKSGSGAIYIFEKINNAWSQTSFIKASSSESSIRFGFDIAISDDGQTLATTRRYSYHYETPRESQLHIYRKGNASWNLVHSVQISNGVEYDKYNGIFDISGNGQLVALGFDTPSSSSNNSKIQFYSTSDGSSWSLDQELSPSFATNHVAFIREVALDYSGETLLTTHPNRLAIYKKTNGTWAEDYEFPLDATEDRDGIYSLDISGDGLTVVATDSAYQTNGKAWLYKYENSTWTEKFSLVGSSNNSIHSVRLKSDGTSLLITNTRNAETNTGFTSPDASSGHDFSGVVFKYDLQDNGSWSKDLHIKPNVSYSDLSFGVRANISDNNTLAISAYKEDSNATGINGDQTDQNASDSGAAFIY